MGTFTIRQTRDKENLYLYPNVNGCNIDFTPFGEVNNFECVDDIRVIPDDDVTYVYSNATDLEYDLYELPNHTIETGTINYVQVYARAKSHSYAQHPDGIYKIILTDNACSNIYKSNDIDLITGYRTYNNVWTENPRTAAAWTWNDIDNLEIGNECSSPTIPGASLVLVIRPTGDSHTELHPYPSGANFSKIDEAIFDSSDLVYADGSSWHRDAYDATNHTTESGTITKIIQFYYSKNWALGISHAQGIINTHDTLYYGIDNTLINEWVLYSDEWESNPSTSMAWTWAEVDALKLGLRMRTSGVGGSYEADCAMLYTLVYYTENINPQIRTTQCYAKVNYTPEPSECTLQKPEQLSVNHAQNIKMLNFWSENRAVYGISRANKTLVMTGTQYDTNADVIMECVRMMGENGSPISLSGVGSKVFDTEYRIASFGCIKISEKPLAYQWILECEFTT